MLLRVQNLSIQATHRGKQTDICKDLSFTLNDGENVGILGESGSGKSITALSMLGLLPPSLSITQGSILYTSRDGSTADLVSLPQKKFQHLRGSDIAMVFQEPMSALNPVFTCGDQVLETIRRHYPGLNHHIVKTRVLELFDQVKLVSPKRIFDSYPHQLSGGQKQRVMIAMAISCNPRLLIADEPTTALDVTVQKSIIELLKQLQSDLGMSILFITHDISVIAEIAHRILVFYKGELVEQGEVDQILHKATHLYTKGLLSCRSSIHKKGEPLATLEDYFINQSNDNPPVLISPEKTHPPTILPQKPEPILSVQDLVVSFSTSSGIFGNRHKKNVLKKINFYVNKGETLGLVGESGSGKTTIGRSIMKLISSDEGDVLLYGKSSMHLDKKELQEYRKKVQIIFQDPYSSLNPKMTIGETIAEPLKVHKLYPTSTLRRERVLWLLTQVGLTEDQYNRYPHQFSGGQRQRIGIARALAMEPELLILDESVSALDVSVQAQIINLLNQLKKNLQLTFIFISHDLNTVRYMADRIIVLRDGEIVEEGFAEDLFSSPKHEYTLGLLKAIPGTHPSVINKADE